LYRKLHQDAFTLEALRNLGNVYVAQKKFSKARECFMEGMRYAKANNDLYSVSGFYHRLAETNAGLAAYDLAYTYLDSAIEKLNTIYEENTHKYKMESETKYETSQKEAELKLKTVQRDGIMIVLIVALSLSIIIVFLSRQRQKAVTSLREKEETLHRQEVGELLKKQEISSLTSYLQGQDQERKRIAEDLHDRLGSTLSATKLYLNSEGDKNSVSYSKANLLLDQAVEEVREISHDLLSGTLSKFGLLLALEELKNTVSASERLKMEIFTHGVERLPVNIEIMIYRIVQEL
jgi:signal transduction histidine kinase